VDNGGAPGFKSCHSVRHRCWPAGANSLATNHDPSWTSRCSLERSWLLRLESRSVSLCTPRPPPWLARDLRPWTTGLFWLTALQPWTSPAKPRESARTAKESLNEQSPHSHHRLMLDVCTMLRVDHVSQLIPVLGQVIRVAVTVPPALEHLRAAVSADTRWVGPLRVFLGPQPHLNTFKLT